MNGVFRVQLKVVKLHYEGGDMKLRVVKIVDEVEKYNLRVYVQQCYNTLILPHAAFGEKGT